MADLALIPSESVLSCTNRTQSLYIKNVSIFHRQNCFFPFEMDFFLFTQSDTLILDMIFSLPSDFIFLWLLK